MRNVDPLAKACIWTLDDAFDVYFPWGFNLSDLLRIVFNLGYRFGNIYDLTYELTNIFTLQMVQGYLNELEWQYIGGIPGRIVSEIFYPEQYEPLPIVYPVEDY